MLSQKQEGGREGKGEGKREGRNQRGEVGGREREKEGKKGRREGARKQSSYLVHFLEFVSKSWGKPSVQPQGWTGLSRGAVPCPEELNLP